MKTLTTASLVILSLGAPCAGQSLNERDPATTPAHQPAIAVKPVDPSVALQGVSLIAVTPPPPKTFKKNDLIEIIINESSLQKHEQSLDTKKDYTTKSELTKIPSLHDLAELQLRNPANQSKANLELTSNNKFKGEGQYERTDRFTARITAVVLEVKPNGTLVLEAKKSFTSNKEETAMIMSGVCRSEDITVQNTVQSAQMANLSLTVKNEGDVKDASRKGFIPQVLDTIFNF